MNKGKFQISEAFFPSVKKKILETECRPIYKKNEFLISGRIALEDVVEWLISEAVYSKTIFNLHLPFFCDRFLIKE